MSRLADIPVCLLPDLKKLKELSSYGSYNLAFNTVNEAGQNTIIKIQLERINLDTGFFTIDAAVSSQDHPERSVRLWNLINASLGPAALIKLKDARRQEILAWQCPFVHGSADATDDEIAKLILNTFNRTGRIIIDATGRDNVLSYMKNGTRHIACIDIGMALELEPNAHITQRGLTRRKSVTSLKAFQCLKEQYRHFFKQSSLFYPKAVQITKALILLKKFRPDIDDASWLLHSDMMLPRLALFYDFNLDPGEYYEQVNCCILEAQRALESKSTEDITIPKKIINDDAVQKGLATPLSKHRAYLHCTGKPPSKGQTKHKPISHGMATPLSRYRYNKAIDLKKKAAAVTPPNITNDSPLSDDVGIMPCTIL